MTDHWEGVGRRKGGVNTRWILADVEIGHDGSREEEGRRAGERLFVDNLDPSRR
jgi:hypothetical protein